MQEHFELLEDEQSSSFTSHDYSEIKYKVLERLIDVLDLTILESLDKSTVNRQIREVAERILREDNINLPLNLEEREKFFQDIQDELLGYGPIEPLMRDPRVNDILVNGPHQIYVERNGKLELTKAKFKDDAHVIKIIDRIISPLGRRLDESSPMVDARLPDGSRVNALIPPIAMDGPSISIRRFTAERLELDDLIHLKTLVPEIAELLKGIVQSRLNVLISGGTGSGKTTLLNVLSRFIPDNERVVTIEDSAELQLKQEHVVRLETRPPNIEGKGEITARALVKNCLRMRPDRIIVGEVRSEEVIEMLQAMNTGHDGSLTTIHANSPRDALLRVETLVSMSGLEIPHETVRRYVCSAIDVVIQCARLIDGSRKVISLQEITGMEGSIITMQDIFSFEQTGLDNSGAVKGKYKMNGIIPKFVEKFESFGIPVNYAIFNTTLEV
ncbi:MAG: CpaF family protein [bacterium]